MPLNTHLAAITAEMERLPEPDHAAQDPLLLRQKASELAHSLTWLPNFPSSDTFTQLCKSLARDLKPLFAALERPLPELQISDDFRWLYENSPLLYSVLPNAAETLKSQSQIPHVRTREGKTVPRVLGIAEGFLAVVSNAFYERELILFLEAFQETTPLQVRELWMLVPVLKLVLLEQIVARGKFLLDDPTDESRGVGVCVRSLRDLGQTTWKDTLEPLMRIDQILQEDPAGAYSRMDFESRDLYRTRLSKIAEHSDCSEMAVAKMIVALAEKARTRRYADRRRV